MEIADPAPSVSSIPAIRAPPSTRRRTTHLALQELSWAGLLARRGYASGAHATGIRGIRASQALRLERIIAILRDDTPPATVRC